MKDQNLRLLNWNHTLNSLSPVTHKAMSLLMMLGLISLSACTNSPNEGIIADGPEPTPLPRTIDDNEFDPINDSGDGDDNDNGGSGEGGDDDLPPTGPVADFIDAVLNNKKNQLIAALDAGVSPNTRIDGVGNTGMHISPERRILMVLAHYGANVNLGNHNGMTAFDVAFRDDRDNDRRMDTLMEVGAYPGRNYCPEDLRLIWDMARYGFVKCVEMSVEEESGNLLLQNGLGQTPVHLGMENGNPLLLNYFESYYRMLLDTDGRKLRRLLGLKDRELKNILHAAVEFGRESHAVDLLSFYEEENLHIQDRSRTDRKNVLHLAVAQNLEDFIEAAVDYKISRPGKVNLDIFDVDNMTPFALAAMYDHVEIATELVRPDLGNQRANVNLNNRERMYPIHFAAENGSEDIFMLLMEDERTRLNVVGGEDNGTALHSAINADQDEIVTIFIEYLHVRYNLRQAINIMFTTDRNGYTPFMYAAYQNDRRNSLLLINEGVADGRPHLLDIQSRGERAYTLTTDPEIKGYIENAGGRGE